MARDSDLRGHCTHQDAEQAGQCPGQGGPRGTGVVILEDVRQRAAVFSRMPVSEVWGVGRRLESRLQALEIHTVGQAQADPGWIRQHFSVVLERTVREGLPGIRCG